MQAQEPPEREIKAAAAHLLGLLEDSSRDSYSLTVITPFGASTLNVSLSTGHDPNEFSEHCMADESMGTEEIVMFMIEDD